MFYCEMKGIEKFAANLLSYILTKYCYNWSTSDLVIVKTKRVNFLETQYVSTRRNRRFCRRERRGFRPTTSATIPPPALALFCHHANTRSGNHKPQADYSISGCVDFSRKQLMANSFFDVW